MEDDEFLPPESSPPNFLGITSFVIGIINVVLAFLMFAIVATAVITEPHTLHEDSPILLIIGLIVIACLLMGLIGIGLGVAGMLISNPRKVFAIFGTVINTGVVAVILAIIGLGLAKER